jgi:stage II sporulation protein D
MGLSVHRERRRGDHVRCARPIWRRTVALGGLCWLAAWLVTGCTPRQGYSPTPQMDLESQFWVRVLLSAGRTQCRIEAPSTLTVNSVGQTSPSQVEQTGARQVADELEVSVQPTGLNVGGRVFRSGCEVEILPAKPYVFRLDGAAFRGTVHLVFDGEGRHFDVVNWVPLEPYLAGVVGAEMPSYWEPQALQAQAVAARTYCWSLKERVTAGRHWDIRRTEGHQVYRGLAAESAPVWEAVKDTTGVVLVAPAGPNGIETVFPAYYSAICGGHTESGTGVFGDSSSALAAVDCPFCEDTARKDHFCWPPVQLEKRRATELLSRHYTSLKALDAVDRIEPSRQSTYPGFSRITQFRLVGSNGRTETVRAEDLRLVLDPSGRKIRSTCFQVSDTGESWTFVGGRGWGHGVGMCQTGAQGMARRGWVAADILQHYYPGSRLLSLY